ncbi:hypothetical protein BVG79_01555 [Ketogulonicigenium robustum]|uniref:HTH gntR-type domain-containing protein n=1 Tax=Ketogulonicigenium robustum TaxID=92947 RepID=A0A1W6P0C7_9RHOB|nr:hypothetical protein [Ketogulonicigenium robustum]ARO14899.1 hypothetical protein BVG79_01555 [Ketogulonicigenium robustum]
MKVGDRIESQNEIAAMGFSLVTVLRTLRDMEADDIIYRQVGRGSFLVRLPWAETYLRIGWFYNRDTVPNGIFSNPLYSHIVAALENTVVSDGHAFVLGSFTNRKMPLELWDRLDAVILFGIAPFSTSVALKGATSLIAAMDMIVGQDWTDSYTIDVQPAFEMMVHQLRGRPTRILYVDGMTQSEHVSDRCARIHDFSNRVALHEIEILAVDFDRDDEAIAALLTKAARFRPDIVCGFLKEAWVAALANTNAQTKIYPVTAQPNTSGFAVDGHAWARVIADRLYACLADRTLPVMVLRFPANFVA